MDNFVDVELPRPYTVRQLSIAMGKSKEPGQYHITPVPLATFDSWANSHPDCTLSLQYTPGLLVVNIMHPPHDGVAGIIGAHIVQVVHSMCPQNDAEVWPSTGLTNLTNGIRKNGDAHVYTHQGNQAPYYPGVVIEVGYSDSRKKRQDIRLWLENSDCNVKLGIACKIGVDAQKQINKLIFEIFDFDFTQCSRDRPLGRSRLVTSFDWSEYDGTDQTLPPVTTYQIPSYAIFSDGIYPASFPEHPNPPPALLKVTNAGREYPLSLQDLGFANRHVHLFNTQRSPVTVDFRIIAQSLRKFRSGYSACCLLEEASARVREWSSNLQLSGNFNGLCMPWTRSEVKPNAVSSTLSLEPHLF